MVGHFTFWLNLLLRLSLNPKFHRVWMSAQKVKSDLTIVNVERASGRRFFPCWLGIGNQGLKLCVFWHKVCRTLTLSSVQLLECVMWSSKMQWRFMTEMLSLSWYHGKNEQICTVKFQNFLGAMPPGPHTGEGLWCPSPNLTPLALRCFAPLSGPSAPPLSLSVCSWHFEIFLALLVMTLVCRKYCSRNSLITTTQPSARNQLTLWDHRYGLVYNAMCLFTPQLSLGILFYLPTEVWLRLSRAGCLVLHWGSLPIQTLTGPNVE